MHVKKVSGPYEWDRRDALNILSESLIFAPSDDPPLLPPKLSPDLIRRPFGSDMMICKKEKLKFLLQLRLHFCHRFRHAIAVAIFGRHQAKKNYQAAL